MFQHQSVEPKSTTVKNVEADEPVDQVTFADLGLAPEILKALNDIEHFVPTPIQAATIPLIIEGRDILGIARTGTGKTGGFLLPALHRIFQSRTAKQGFRVLILSPTRELANQTFSAAMSYSKYTRSRQILLVGGTDLRRQEMSLRKPWDIAVVTPGRLLDHLRRGNINLAHISMVIIDEADRMLDMGFFPDIQAIVAGLPQDRQSLLFSATLPPRIQELARSFQRDAAIIRLNSSEPSSPQIEQEIVTVSHGSQKLGILKTILDSVKNHTGQTIVFTRTKRGAEELSISLSGEGYSTDALHGDKSQHVRNRVLARFRKGDLKILVATDVAARGLDIEGITHVINYDLPQTAEDYVHRIGRTGRAGRTGKAISFYHPADTDTMRSIERMTGEPIPRHPLSVPHPTSYRPRTGSSSGPRSGSGRPSYGSGGGSDRSSRSGSGGRRTTGGGYRSSGSSSHQSSSFSRKDP